MTKDEAVALQVALTQRGLPIGKAGADGWVGAQTRKALRAFQRARGLPATGEPDGPTLAALVVPNEPPIIRKAASAPRLQEPSARTVRNGKRSNQPRGKHVRDRG